MKQQITVRLEEEDMEQIKALAQANQRPVANFITWVVVQYLRDHKERS